MEYKACLASEFYLSPSRSKSTSDDFVSNSNANPNLSHPSKP
ncbi:hypothetical protein LEP1GSC062_1544 [Leptospira alexanderi serovar Manhao 3 str. L 60]|uniref:Uncharacterized protein n=1 Tax=Leptospira alexanderi serovar Manhao 3 str. L 60 TaxID=1049759 RepID=V6HVW3_9LEPT|nr:hypothetical protein LEP1GSC062_1544 [Leptospira alexanderi serovar Manhao 3 str. L 60]